MGAANCCKKPSEIVLNDEIKQAEGEKQNAQDRDSYPQDTEFIQKEEYAQQDISNQKLYEQESSPKIGGAYEVPINESSPVQYNQIGEYDNNMQNLNLNLDQYNQEELAQYNLNNQIINNGEIKDLENINQTEQSVQKPGEPIKNDAIQSNISNISNLQQVDNPTLISQRSAAPINLISQVANTKQMASIPESNNEEINIPQQPSQIQPQQQQEKEDLNKYFQIPSNISNPLAKTKTSEPGNINMDDIEKLIQQNQNQQQANLGNIASVAPTKENDDLNKYFKSMTLANQNPIDLNKFFQTGIKQNDIINMKDLPETFGSNNINNYIPQQQETKTTTTIKTTQVENINPAELKKIEVNVNESLPETFGSNNIQQLGLEQYPETKINNNVSEKIENNEVKNIPKALTNSQMNEIINMKDLPQTFGSNNINTYNKTKTTTITKTTGDIDLNNLQRNLTVSQINNIINMKDLPQTIGSNNMQQTTTTTISKTNDNIPIDLKQNGITQEVSPSVESKEKDINRVTNTVQSSIEIPTEDYSKYFGQQGVNQKTSSPVDLQQIDISNILHGSNITFKQPSQDLNSYANINNYQVSQPVIKTAVSSPIVTTGNVNNLNTQKTTTTTTTTNINPTLVAQSTVTSPGINLNNYGLNNAQQKTTTTTTTIKTTGIPTGTSYTQKYGLLANYILNKVNTTKVAQPYAGQNQILGYSYTMPTTSK
jgi:hypothetical protein